MPTVEERLHHYRIALDDAAVDEPAPQTAASESISPRPGRGAWLVAATVVTVVGLGTLAAVRDTEPRSADQPVPTADPASTTNSTTPLESASTAAPAVVDWSNPPAARAFDEPAEFSRLWDLVLQGELDQCMTAAGFEYRRSPATDSPATELVEWQDWVDAQSDTGGWTIQKAQCADEFVLSDWYGEVNSLNYIGQATNQWGGNISAIYQRPDMIEATRAVVECAQDAGIQIAADPAPNAQDAYEEVWIVFSAQIERAIDNIPDNDLSGIEQMDQFRLDRAAAIDSICPAFSNSEKVFANAQREDQTAWLQAHPDVAQRVADEWADDIIRLQAILDAQPS